MSANIYLSAEASDAEIIEKNLYAFNVAHIGELKTQRETLVARDEDDTLLGGLVFHIQPSGKAFDIDLLFVAEAARGQSIGSKLLAEAEKIAKERQCNYIWLYTNTFQAPGFYPKLNYKLIATREDCPVEGNTVFYYRKDI